MRAHGQHRDSVPRPPEAERPDLHRRVARHRERRQARGRAPEGRAEGRQVRGDLLEVLPAAGPRPGRRPGRAREGDGEVRRRVLPGRARGRIVGASGLLLGLGRLYEMNAVCLMGETSGYFVDPKSAQAVLEVLTKYLGIEISFNELEAKAKQIDQITSKLKDIEAAPETPDKREDLGYIG